MQGWELRSWSRLATHCTHKYAGRKSQTISSGSTPYNVLHGWYCVRCRTGGFINIRLGWHRLCLVTNQAVICDPECPKSAPLSTGNLVNRAYEIHALPVRTHPSSNRATHKVYFVPRFSASFSQSETSFYRFCGCESIRSKYIQYLPYISLAFDSRIFVPFTLISVLQFGHSNTSMSTAVS